MDILAADFDPIKFLKLNQSSFTPQEVLVLREELKKQLGEYIMLKFSSSLSPNQLDAIVGLSDRTKILQTLQANIPDFDRALEKELESFREEIGSFGPGTYSEARDKGKKIVDAARFQIHQQVVRGIGIIAVLGVSLFDKSSVSSFKDESSTPVINEDLAEKEASIKAQIAQIIKGEEQKPPLSSHQAANLSYDLISIDRTLKAWVNPAVLYKYPELNLKEAINDVEKLKNYRDSDYLFENNPADKRKSTDRVVSFLIGGGKGGKVVTAYRDENGNIYKARIVMMVNADGSLVTQFSKEQMRKEDLKRVISGLYNIPNQIHWDENVFHSEIKGVGKAGGFNVELKASGNYMEINIEQETLPISPASILN